MRGKLRDKRSSARRDYFKREEQEQRRPHKKELRNHWVDQDLEESDDYIADDEPDMDAEEREISSVNKK